MANLTGIKIPARIAPAYLVLARITASFRNVFHVVNREGLLGSAGGPSVRTRLAARATSSRRGTCDLNFMPNMLAQHRGIPLQLISRSGIGRERIAPVRTLQAALDCILAGCRISGLAGTGLGIFLGRQPC